jgi:hypothetical protein
MVLHKNIKTLLRLIIQGYQLTFFNQENRYCEELIYSSMVNAAAQ